MMMIVMIHSIAMSLQKKTMTTSMPREKLTQTLLCSEKRLRSQVLSSNVRWNNKRRKLMI